jgi:preprotein translocase subunit YajC
MFTSLILATADTVAQAADSKPKSNPLIGMLPILLIGVAMYFVMIRPQKRKMKAAQTLLQQLTEGDEVITTGGIYGFINAIDGDTIWLDIADNVEIRMHRSSISRRIDPKVEPAGGEPAKEAGGEAETPESDKN